MSEKNSPGKDANERDRLPSGAVWAIILIAVGAVFLLMEAGVVNRGGNWWVIFLLIPGLALLWGAYTTYARAGALTNRTIMQVIAGGGLVLLTAIFVFDPTWSFTRGVNWDLIWPSALIVLGVGMLVAVFWRRRD